MFGRNVHADVWDNSLNWNCFLMPIGVRGPPFFFIFLQDQRFHTELWLDSPHTCAPTPIECSNWLRLRLRTSFYHQGRLEIRLPVVEQDPPLEGLKLIQGNVSTNWSPWGMGGQRDQWSLSAVIVTTSRRHRRNQSSSSQSVVVVTISRRRRNLSYNPGK